MIAASVKTRTSKEGRLSDAKEPWNYWPALDRGQTGWWQRTLDQTDDGFLRRLHWHCLSVSLSACVCLSVYVHLFVWLRVSVWLSLRLCLPVCLYICVSVCILVYVYLCLCLCACPYMSVSLCLSACVCLYLFGSVSFVCLSVLLSVHMFVCLVSTIVWWLQIYPSLPHFVPSDLLFSNNRSICDLPSA